MSTYYMGGPFSAIAGFAFWLLLVVGLATWVILAASRFVHGGAVERPERVAQLYGYTVCLIAVIVGLVSIVQLVDAAFDQAAPQFAGNTEWGWQEPSVSSFEAYRATYERAQQMRGGAEGAKPDTVPEPELRRRFEALRADRIERVGFRARRSMVTNVLTLLLAAGLFVWHWRWVRRRMPGELSATAP